MDPHSPHEDKFPWWKNTQYQQRMLIIVILSSVLIWIGNHHRQPMAPIAEEAQTEPTPAPQPQIVIPLPTPLPPWPAFSHPSPQRQWAEIGNPKVYMPTGSGRVASAGYGSVRTNSSGRATFHEGVDIAPTEWSRGLPQDKIFAASDGRIGYVNRVGGNSSYGKYVVVEHQDDLGEVYTIYAHLASVPPEIQTGVKVTRGQEIAKMGHSSTLGIPAQRSHLHFEMGVMLNPDYKHWYRAKKLTPSHGNFHGWNFTGFDPRYMLIPLTGKEQVPFSYLETLRKKDAAWEVLVRNAGRPRYFDMYPKLWSGEPYRGQVMHLRISESGIPLSGRNATASEIDQLGSGKNKILTVNKEVLGRNGLRHVIQSGGKWKLGSNGTRWLEILLYNAR
ncbi:M23 family metallopeptidase [Kiritimatiellaeota bacterium B1221]|nr:M23 family metallopeptidase [Kiritimatiellaeota bacterium B1221]